MILKPVESASGSGILLHSRYNPQKEAQRFVEAGLRQKTPGIIIVLGAGLGYIAEAVKKRHPRARLICLYYAESLFKQSFCKGDENWHPQAGTTVIGFLYARLNEPDVEGLEYLEWLPSAVLFPEIARKTNTALRQVIRELSGNLVTTVGAGRLWIRNTIFNFLCLKNPVGGNLCPGELPVAIMASGPSLEQAYPLIKQYRQRLRLWVLPSALGFCKQNGIVPDLVIVTDPGYYSTRHFLENGFQQTPVAMPFSACRGLWNRKGDTFLFSQANYIEEMVLASLAQKPPVVPQNGTVAGTALLLALRFSLNRIIVLGLDMCFRDIFAHARPGSFDAMLYNSSQRLSPFLGTLYSRALETAPLGLKKHLCRTSPAYATYSGWFARLSGEIQKRIYRLHPSPVEIPGLRSLDEAQLAGFLGPLKREKQAPTFTPLRPYPAYKERKNQVITILRQWLDQLQNTDIRQALLHGQPLSTLLYFTSTRMLLEYKRSARLGDAVRAKNLVGSLRDENIGFVSGLLAKISAGERS